MAMKNSRGFTLIEVLVVIAIIAVLMGLLFPAYQGVMERAKKVQAKNDLTQIVTAVNAYYTEYGKYPLPDSSQGFGEDFSYSYDGTGTPPNSDLMKTLMGNDATANPRNIVFLSPKTATTAGAYGVQPVGSAQAGLFLDPWNRGYAIVIDSDYNNIVRERGTGIELKQGAIAWSLGKKNDWDASGIASWK